ncbi:conserved protein of unknown function [Hyphomicrobium sp. 1Nfss2.1]|uniref:hypothetical protein n=1 Tax=Hyphomicrobium sp. 1Nfss2.1 TaxID=3413936 RepID=UPI003C7E8BB3
MVTWRNRSIDSLSTMELRLALDDAINQIAWSQAEADSTTFFQALLAGFVAGAAVVTVAILTFSLIG